MTEHAGVLGAVDVEVALEHDAVLGEGAGLVAAEHVHGAEVLDRRQLLDDHLPAGERARALGEARGHDDGKHLGRDADGDACREQQCVDHVALGPRVDGEDGRCHDEHQAHEHPRDASDAAIESARLAGVTERGGHRSQIAVAACGADRGDGRAALDRGPGENDVSAGGEGKCRPISRG